MIKRGPELLAIPAASRSDLTTEIQLENNQVTLSRVSISRDEEAQSGEFLRMKSIHPAR